MDSIIDILKRVSKASVSVKNSTKEIRKKTLLSLAELLRQNTEKIIVANQLD